MNSEGLAGCDKLAESDHIVIFFTQNAKKIDMSNIANHGNASLKMIEISAGKQSTDIHIGSYLGYLVGINTGKDCSVVIVSKDADFDNVIKFWKTKFGLKASRAKQIKASIQKTVTAKQSSPKKTTNKVDGDIKTKLNEEIMKAIRSGGFDASLGNSVAQLVINLYGKEGFASKVHNELRQKYTNYLDLYGAIKLTLTKYDKMTKSVATNVAPTGQDKNLANTEIMQLLSKAGYANDVTTYVASVVVANMGVKNGKQLTYRTIISKYSQEKGLAIYNQIKKHIQYLISVYILPH